MPAVDVLIFEMCHKDRVFHRKSKETEPEAKPDSEPADDIENIKAWIVHIADPAFKESARRDQVNRDAITRVNNRCTDF